MDKATHIRFKDWFDVFCRDLERDYHIEQEVMAEIVHNATCEVNFDPFVESSDLSFILLPNKPLIRTYPKTKEDKSSIIHNAVTSKNATEQDFEDRKIICHGFQNPLKRERLDSSCTSER